jgi:integrase
MAHLAALTMMRLTEIRTLRREQVDLGQGVVTLPRTKTVPRHVVLSGEAQTILKRALETAKGDVLFPNLRKDGKPYSRVYIGRVWRTAARAAGLVDFHFHSRLKLGFDSR